MLKHILTFVGKCEKCGCEGEIFTPLMKECARFAVICDRCNHLMRYDVSDLIDMQSDSELSH